MIIKTIRERMVYGGTQHEQTVEIRIFGILVYRRLVNGGCP